MWDVLDDFRCGVPPAGFDGPFSFQLSVISGEGSRKSFSSVMVKDPKQSRCLFRFMGPFATSETLMGRAEEIQPR